MIARRHHGALMRAFRIYLRYFGRARAYTAKKMLIFKACLEIRNTKTAIIIPTLLLREITLR